MSIKSILTLFNGQPQDMNALDSAFSLAHAARAHLRVVHLLPPPVLPEVTSVGIYNGLGYNDTATLDILDKQTAQAEVQVKDHAVRYGVPFHVPGEETAIGQAQTTFRKIVGDARQCLAEQASTVDMIITGYDNRPAGDLAVVLASLFQAGCPVLALPRNPAARLPAAGYGRIIVFAWDGSRSSAQALRDAVPHMLRAEEVFIIHVQSPADSIEPEVKSDLLAYLRSHCIVGEFIYLEHDGRKTGEVVLEEAMRLKADLLAMGAYGHNHISEMLLGGVTDYVLKHAKLPLLLAH